MTTNIKNKYLYHYTSMDVLINILNNYREKLSDGKNKDLIFWASSIFTMNDPQEMNHGINVFKVLVPFNEDFYQVDPEERLDTSTIDIKQVFHDYTHTLFVLSFSSNSDDFAMWKTYGGGGYGIALKFLNDVSSTPCFFNSTINPKNVYYGNGLDRFDAFVEIYNKGLDKLRKCVNEEERMICKKITLSDIYYHLCPYIKTESYKNENERRISYNNVPVNYVKFRSRNKNIIPYIEAPIPSIYVYQNDYILRGTVTFSATNVEVKKSEDVQSVRFGNRTFVPNFINLENDNGYYALNVNNDIEAYQGSENEGSVFIQNLRRVHPFEAYMTSTSATRSIGIFDGMTTVIKGISDIENGQQTLKVYNLNGQCIKTVKSMESLKHELPAGLYIINNKKVIVK